MSDVAVRVDNVSKSFRLYAQRNQTLKAALMRGGRAKYTEFPALADVSFEIPAGTTFGLIGENGSGKSTLLKVIAKILVPDRGSVTAHGKMAALLELGSGFHPELSGRENVFLNGSILGLSKKELARKFDEIVDFAGVEQFIDQPVKNYSSGMYVRLGFSIAINIDPEILLVDEVLAVGDAAFQRKCQEKFADYRRAGKTVVIVSHDSGAMRSMCDQVAWLEHGRVKEVGVPNEVVDTYLDDGHEERQEMTTGGARYGSGEGRILAVDLLGPDGGPAPRLHAGDPLHLRLVYSATEAIRRPVFGLGIETLGGQVLWGSNTAEAGVEIDVIDGVGSIDFRIPALPLQGEGYDVLVALTDHTTTHVYDFLRKCVRLDLTRARPVESGGPLVLQGEWGRHRPGDVELPALTSSSLGAFRAPAASHPQTGLRP